MEKLTGHGRPSDHLAGIVGQHYEDLDTGDIYECRFASEWSPLLGAPVGGYVWERRAKGEDIREIYGSAGGSSWNDLTDKPFGEEVTEIVFVDTDEINGEYDSHEDCSKAILVNLAGFAPTQDTKCHVVYSVDNDVYEEDFVVSGSNRISLKKFYARGGYHSVEFSEGSCYLYGPGGTRVILITSIKIITVESNAKTIDPRYLPKSLQFGNNPAVAIVENWNDSEETNDGTHLYYYKSGQFRNKYLPDGFTIECEVDGVKYCGVPEEFTYQGPYSQRTIKGFGNKHIISSSAEDTGEPIYVRWSHAFSGGIYYDFFEICFADSAWSDSNVVSLSVRYNEIVTISADCLPKATAVADVTDAPTAEQFNALLASLREAGYLSK